MYAAFVKLLNMSASAGILIASVILLRLLLRRAPKKYICLLWAIAALRLCCPFSISSAVSAYNYLGTQQTGGQMAYVQYNGKSEKPMAELPAFRVDVSRDSISAAPQKKDFSLPTAMGLWAAGVGMMLSYAAASYLRLRKQTAEAVRLRRNIYICDHLPSPFVLGIVRPKIYLPSELNDPQRGSVIAHEQAHIRRLDHWWKPLGFVILSVHWFNPLVWVGYILLSRDIETACDERVIEKMTSKQKQNYSETLLQCSMPRKFISACPLAFGETGVKQRIRGILNYRRPTAWITALALLICLLAGTVFLTDPVQAENAAAEPVQYTLTVGDWGITRISVETPNGTGVCEHADGSVIPIKESVTLEALTGARNLHGVTFRAYAGDGEPVWVLSIPEDAENGDVMWENGWVISKLSGKPNTEPDEIISFGPLNITCESLSFALPQQFHFINVPSQGNGTFTVDGEVVGGVNCYEVDAGKLLDGFGWVKELDFPEWKLDNIGYMADGVQMDNYTVETFSDVPPGQERTVHNFHYLYYYDDIMHDLWFDGNQVDPDTQSKILRTVSLGGLYQVITNTVTPSRDTNVYGIRSEEGIVTGVLPANAPLLVLHHETQDDGEWIYGRNEDSGVIGWIKWDDSMVWGNVMHTERQTNEFPQEILVGTVSGPEILNVRSGAGELHEVVAYLDPDTLVNIFETVSVDGVEWGRIGNDAWVCMNYITLWESSLGQGEDMVCQDDTILYSSPSTHAREIGHVGHDEHVTIHRTENLAGTEWCYVSYGNTMGWTQALHVTARVG